MKIEFCKPVTLINLLSQMNTNSSGVPACLKRRNQNKCLQYCTKFTILYSGFFMAGKIFHGLMF